MILEIKIIPTLLNRLYIPIIKNGKPTIIKNPKSKEFTSYINDLCLVKRVKPFQKDVLFYMDILISKRKSYDIDGMLKLLFDSLNGHAGTGQRVHYGAECTGGSLWRYCHCCHERGIPYFQFRIQCGTGYRSGLPAGILLQLWGKEVFPCKESVLVHPVCQPGNHGSVRRCGVCVPQRAVAAIPYGYGCL